MSIVKPYYAMRHESSETDNSTAWQATLTSGLTSGNRPRRSSDEPSKKLPDQDDYSVRETLTHASPYSVPISAVPRLSLDSGASVFNPKQNKLPTATTLASAVTSIERAQQLQQTSSVSLRSVGSWSNKPPFATRFFIKGTSPTPREATLIRPRCGRLLHITETIEEESCELGEEETFSQSLARPIRGGSVPNEVLTRMLTYREEQIGSYRPHARDNPESSEHNLQLLRELCDAEPSVPKDRGRMRPAHSLDLSTSKIAIHAHTRTALRSSAVESKKKSDVDSAPTN